MSKIERFFGWVSNFKHIAHGTMVAFAAASLGNIRAFLVTAGHPTEVAWALGIALGTALVTVSIMLSHLDRRADANAWGWLLATGIVLALVSGSVQSAEYARHLALPWAMLLGFAGPIGGEILLALAVSNYSRAKERERFRSVSALIENAVVGRLEDAINDLDPSTIHRVVESTITRLARQAVTHVAVQAGAYYATNNTLQPLNDDTDIARAEPPKLNAESDSLAQANAERQQTIERRRKQVLNIVRAMNSASVSEIAEQLGEDAPSRGTLTADLSALAEQRLVYNQDRKWHATTTVMPLPVPVAHTNGHHNGIEVLK